VPCNGLPVEYRPFWHWINDSASSCDAAGTLISRISITAYLTVNVSVFINVLPAVSFNGYTTNTVSGKEPERPMPQRILGATKHSDHLTVLLVTDIAHDKRSLYSFNGNFVTDIDCHLLILSPQMMNRIIATRNPTVQMFIIVSSLVVDGVNHKRDRDRDALPRLWLFKVSG